MNRGALVLFISLAVVACFRAIDCEEEKKEEEDRRLLYVEFPLEEELESSLMHVVVREALTKVELPSAETMDIFVALSEAKKNEQDESHRQIYEYMLRLGNTLKQDCSAQMTEVYISLWAQSMKNEKLVPFYNYIDPKKFLQCADKFNKRFIKKPLEYDATKDLFRLMCATTGVNPSERNNVNLYLNLKNFSLTEMGKLHVRRMVEAVEEIGTTDIAQNPDMYQKLQYFWSPRCEVLDQNSLPFMLNIMSLAQTKDFNYEAFDPQLLLLNEYRRFCKQWRDGPGLIEKLIKSVEDKIKAEQAEEATDKKAAAIGASA